MLNTEVLWNDAIDIAERYLAADGSTDDASNLQSAIESEEGNTLVLHEGDGVINIGSQCAPSTNGDETTILCVGSPTIDVLGSSAKDIVTFVSAPNISIKGTLHISGTTGDGVSFALRVGDGFHADELVFNGGQGAFVAEQVTDVTVDGLTVTNQHDTDQGQANAVRIGGVEDVEIEVDEISDCDRAVDVDDVGHRLVQRRRT